MALLKQGNKNSIKKLPSPKAPPSKKHIIDNVLVYSGDAKRALKKRKINRYLQIIFFILILAEGLVLLGMGYYEKVYKYKVLSFEGSAYEVVVSEKREDNPTNIVIKSIDIDIELERGYITDGVWKISETYASYLSNSSNPGEGGNVVVYGHNKEHIFGNLKNIKKDDIVRIVTEKGLNYTYKVEEIKIVKPNVIEDVQPKDYEVLTIFTCIGLLDSDRLIVKAVPII